MKFRKKPIVIEAIQYQGTFEDLNNTSGDVELKAFVGSSAEIYGHSSFIKTLEGSMRVIKNDWVIKGINGEFYPCKNDIFEKTYEKVED